MADGIGSKSRSMFGIVGLDGTNTNCSQLNWKTVTKGKRSRKSVARTGRSMLASEIPKREGEFSGSDADKFDEPPLADGLECVPIKKRRHLIHSPSPSQNIDQLSPQQGTPSSHSENFEPLSDNNGVSGNQSPDSHSNIQRLAGGHGNKSDDGVVGNNMVSRDTDNLSGITLLAAAACFSSVDDNPHNVKQHAAEASSTLRKCDDTFTVTIPVGESIQCSSEDMYQKGRLDLGHEKRASFAEDSSGHILAENKQGAESMSFSSKVDRRHWDLNTVMEEWEEEPQEDLVVRKNSVGEASIEGWQKEKLVMEEECSAQLDSINNGTSVNHMSLGPVDVATASFKSKVVITTHEIAICQVDDNEHAGSTLLKNCEEQLGLPEVAGLDMSRSVNNSQVKDAEESQKTFELSEDRTILVEDLVGETCKTIDAGISGSDCCHSLKCKDMSTSDISVADQSAVCGDGMCQEEKAVVADAMGTNDVLDLGSEDLISHHQDHLVSRGEAVKTSIPQDSLKTLVGDDYHEAYVSEDDDHGRSDTTQNISEPQIDYDSPYEDGELRGPALYSWDRNEMDEEKECVDYESDGIVGEESDPGDYLGSEVVEAGSEGSQAPEKKYSLPSQVSETVTSNGSLGFKKGMAENILKLKTEAKIRSNQGSGTSDELSIPLVQENDDSVRRKHSFNHADRIANRGSYPGEVGLTMENSQLCVEGSSPFSNTCNRSSKLGDSLARSERSRGADRSNFSGHQLGYNSWNYRDSTQRYQCRGPENHRQTRTRNAADSTDKFDDVNSYENDQHIKFTSKGNQRPFFRRRSPVVRDDYYEDHRRNTRISGYKRGSFPNFSGGFGRGPREEYDGPVDDAALTGRFPCYLSRGERSFSPSNGGPRVSAPCWKSCSRSPHVWQSQRERNPITRRRSSRSPEFRSESNIERSRIPFQNRNFDADCGERFISPPKGRFSPTRNNRWVNNRNFDNTLRHRRSPIGGVSRQSQRVDPVGLSGRLKSDQLRPGARSGRFGTGDKLEENCSDGKHDERLGMVDHSVRHSGTSAILRRPRHESHVNCEDDNSNNVDGRDNERRNLSSFAADYEERFVSPPRGRISPRNNRWPDERNFDNNSPSRHRRSSPPGMFRRTQRSKPDDYFRPVTRPGRFTSASGDRGNGTITESRRRNLE